MTAKSSRAGTRPARLLVMLAVFSGAAPLVGQSPAPGAAGVPLPTELSLEDALQLAASHNPDFRAQESQLRSAELQLADAWGALMPTANLSNSYGYQASGERRVGSVFLAEQPAVYSSAYNLGVSFSLTGASLLRPGQAQAQSRAAEARVAGAGMGLRAQVTDTYLSVLQADAQVEQARTELERTRLNVQQTQAQVEVGAGTPLDIRRAEVQEGQAEVRLIQAENQAVAARLALSRLLGIDVPEDVRLVTGFELFEPNLDAEALLRRALDANPVVHASRLAADASRTEVRMAQSRYLPTLSVSAGLSGSIFRPATLDPLMDDRLRQAGNQFNSCMQDNRIRDLLGDPPRDCAAMNPALPGVEAQIRQQVAAENEGYPFNYRSQPLSLSVGLSVPLFTGFSRGRDVERAHIARYTAEEQVRAQELQLRTEVRTAVRAVDTARRTAGLQDRIRGTAAEELRLAQERFRLGLASSIEVADAQANLSQAERDEISAVYDFHKSVAALEALVGGAVR